MEAEASSAELRAGRKYNKPASFQEYYWFHQKVPRCTCMSCSPERSLPAPSYVADNIYMILGVQLGSRKSFVWQKHVQRKVGG